VKYSRSGAISLIQNRGGKDGSLSSVCTTFSGVLLGNMDTEARTGGAATQIARQAINTPGPAPLTFLAPPTPVQWSEIMVELLVWSMMRYHKIAENTLQCRFRTYTWRNAVEWSGHADDLIID
jgi:hypothetical protein